jgi:uncharacterized protein
MRLQSVPPLLILLVALPLAAAGPDLPSSGPIHVTALAVEDTAQGYVGTAADVEVNVLGGGTGQVYLSTKPLAQTDFQGSARLAAKVAGATLGVDWSRQDYLVSFRSNSTLIGGPSAGAVMTLALTTALHNLLHPDDPWRLDPTVAATGTINPDGTIGPVGGVPAKAEGAAQAGIKTFLYPAGLETATTRKATAQGVQTVQVDMAAHCASLGIACRSVATLPELVQAAAHVRFDTPQIPVPNTTDYAALLSPSVTGQVDALSGRIGHANADSALNGLPPRSQAQVKGQIQAASDELQQARENLTLKRFYAAATASFKGAIAAGRAENLTLFYARNRDEGVVTDAIAACAKAVQDAQDAVDGLTPTTLNTLYAVGAAQTRASEAGDLLKQARGLHDSATTFDDWVNSLYASTFCVERSRTAFWWANLRTTFPAGPPIPDLSDLAQTALDEADDLVSYAQAVLGNQATDAQGKLTEAQDDFQAGHLGAAVVAAADAQSLASVAMQTGGGSAVPATVLAAAQQGAARAIDRARGGGVEPMLSVSLVELAQTQPDSQAAQSLQEYWSARNLALLDLAPPSHETTAQPVAVPGGSGYSSATLAAFLASGLVVGLAGSGIVVVALMGRRAR